MLIINIIAKSSRDLAFVYEEVKLGIFIQGVSGTLYTESEWSNQETANGVAVITENCRFSIALEDAIVGTCWWGGYGTKVDGICTTTDSSVAKTDYKGESNTTTIINALKGTNDGYVDGAPAAEYCRSYIFPNGKVGYLGAAGEWEAYKQNEEAIISAMNVCGGENATSNYWTSTQHSINVAWEKPYQSSISYSGKYQQNVFNRVRAFCSLE